MNAIRPGAGASGTSGASVPTSSPASTSGAASCTAFASARVTSGRPASEESGGDSTGTQSAWSPQVEPSSSQRTDTVHASKVTVVQLLERSPQRTERKIGSTVDVFGVN